MFQFLRMNSLLRVYHTSMHMVALMIILRIATFNVAMGLDIDW